MFYFPEILSIEMQNFVGKHWYSFAYCFYTTLVNWIMESVVQLQSVVFLVLL